MNDHWRTRSWDAVVIGGGHNGLVAAAYLARAGRSVLVLERRELVGGAAVTEELFPGFRYSRAAYVNSLLRPRIVRELELARHGFAMIPRSPASFTPLPDGRSLLLGPDSELNRRQIAAFSKRDAESLPLYESILDRGARVIEPLLDRAPPELFAGPLAERVASFVDLARASGRALRLGKDLLAFLEILTAPARKVLERYFESEPLKATLATDAIIGAMASPSTPGSGYVLFHHVMGETDGARGVWGYVRGGMGALSESIASAACAHGARVVTGQSVERVLVRGGRAYGVALSDGTEIRASRVLSSADPRVTFLRLCAPDDLPASFRDGVAAIDFTSCVTKINLAVDRAPEFSASPGGGNGVGVGRHHHGTIHFLREIDDIERAWADAVAGRASTRPVIEMTIPSSLDETLAPPEKHVISLFVQYTPYDGPEPDGEGWTDAAKNEFADRVCAVIEEYAPGFTASVLHRDVLSPPDLERIFGLTGGNIFHGAMTLDQLFWLRPLQGWARHRTPIEGLFLCGSGAHPGGGVLGAPGRNAARVALASR